LSNELPATQAVDLMSSIYSIWGGRDPAAAALSIRDLDNPQASLMAASSLAEAWATSDPDAALGWAIEYATEKNGDQILQRVVAIMGQDQPDAAAKIAFRLYEEGTSSDIGYELASAWTSHDPHAALNWLAELPKGKFRDKAIRGGIWNVAYSEPKMAAKFTGQLAAGPLRDELLHGVASSWADTDVKGALSWAESFPEGKDRNATLGALAQKWVQHDFTGASAAFETMESGDAKRQLHLNIAQTLAERDPAVAADWLLQNSTPDSDVYAIYAVTDSWAEVDPQAAAEWVQEMPEGSAKNDASGYLASRWSNDPETAKGWILDNASGTSRQRMVQEFTEAWGSVDSPAASEWIESLKDFEDSKVYDHAALGMSNSLMSYHGNEAWNWAKKIEDPEVRETQMQMVADYWRSTNETVAGQWAAEEDLPDSVRQTLLGEEAEQPVAQLTDCDCG